MSISLLFLLILLPSCSSTNPSTLIYSSCSNSHYPPNSPNQSNLNSLLSSLSSASSFSLYSQFTTPPPPIAGLYQCHGDLSLSLCSTCLRSAISLLFSLCSFSSSAAIQLRGCYLRYGNDAFIGRPDTYLRYKTCSTEGNEGGEEFLAARKEALAAVAVAPLTGSSYRVGSAGAVRAEGQCVGDLSMRDCDDCLAAASAKVNETCGGAAAGEVYLGKCYVRYSGEGEHPYVSRGGSNNDDDTAKTVAIMIGIIAVIVFIVICLYYARKKAKGKH